MKKIAIYLILTCLMAVTLMAQNKSAAKLSAEKAGQTGTPFGQIAFIRNNDLWVMDWDGKNQFKVVTAQNADGGISWSPDGKRIAFCRKGQVDVRGPSMMRGGRHSLYDIFIGYIDSAKANNTNFWRQITFDMGGKYPIWADDGSKIYCTYDMHANDVNAIFANYQTAYVDTIPEAKINYFRTDSYNKDSLYILMPTLGPNGMYAYQIIEKTQKKGIGISKLVAKTLTKKDIGNSVKFIQGVTAPSWSPDGKWLAYIDEDMSRMGIYVTNPDLTEKYLVYKPGPGQILQTYQPTWSPNSKWIAFGLQDGSLWSIDLTGNHLRQLTGSGLNFNPVWSKHK